MDTILQGACVDEYKGNKVLILNPTSKFPFKLGAKKCELILKNLVSIKQFVKEYGTLTDPENDQPEAPQDSYLSE